ncbi:MAG: replicative DNA helicase [Clostridia bacterium]|nr:replicative DNA helicase [Clostridia bacterium]
MEENLNRIPHSLEAERSVLGSVIGPAGQSSAADKALEALTAEDFHSAAHRDIFSAMKKLYDSGKSIDLTTLTDVLERDGKLEAVGGNSYLVDLAIAPPSVSNIEHYVEIVTAHSVRRKLMATGNMIAREAVESSKDPKQILDDAERQIYNIAMRKTAEHIPSIGEVYADVYKQIGELMQLKGRRTGIPTGLADLDELTSGLQRGDLIIVAGRPSAGKSAFAFGIAAHAAIRENANVLIFSLEMPREQIVMRIMSSEAGINMHKLRTGELEADEIFRIADQFNTVGEANMLIDDSPLATVAEIRSKCRRVQAQQGLDIVIIDYLQLMQSASRRDSRVLEVAEMTRGLKMIARELNVAIILLSQLSREPDKRKDHMPLMSDLRESGSIEQDADVIMMLYRPATYLETQEAMEGDNTSYINVAKHRNGATASIKVMWVPEIARYTNYAGDPE